MEVVTSELGLEELVGFEYAELGRKKKIQMLGSITAVGLSLIHI